MDTSKNDIAKLYNFAELRKSGCIYVDKTSHLHQLVTWNGIKSFIVTRPRRFGKSLMISTLKEILEGHKELFEGLYIAEKTDYDWPKMPAVSFTLAQVNNESVDALKEALVKMVREAFPERVFDQMPANYQEPEDVFRYAIMHMAAEGKPIALLIDEYDWPIGHSLGKPELAEQLREVMYRFYHTLKTREDDICFLMLTGVARFAQLSVFSGLNNLTDLNGDDRFATMLGYTEAELGAYFGAHMKAHARVMGVSDAQYRKELKHWFNGYCFGKDAETVYNPYSIATTLSRKGKDFGSNWSQSGRPTMLVSYLMKHPEALYESFFNDTVAASDMLLGNTSNLADLPPVAMLYQTGYLTLCGREPITGDNLLRIPDEEIRRDLYGFYVDSAVGKTDSAWREGVVRRLIYDNPSGFIKGMASLYARMHYGSSEDDEKIYEGNYQRVLQAILIACNMPCNAEATQANRNRSDVIVELPTIVYIFELKAGKTDTAETALQQIRDRGYAHPYIGTGRKIYLIGLAFDPETHELKDFKIARDTRE